jgi:hypothetical protein
MKSFFWVICISLILSASAFAQIELLGTACEPYGSVSIRNEPAADNLPVIAYIDGMEVARCFTLGGQYQLTIIKDNPDTPQKDGWIGGDAIIIKVNGNQANPSLAASAGRFRADLVVNTLSVRLDTWGKIKALFK